jgi:cob(I)alamin adenosyltransferase
MRMKGYIQVYTGNGKGKTTAALGLALRAAGAGLKVYFAQFIKGMKYSEHTALEALADNITVRQYGRNCFIKGSPEAEDIKIAREGFFEIRGLILSGIYQVVILDEINIAIHYKLLSVQELLDLFHVKPDDVEVIITGRNADQRIIDAADLVTEMREVKHYYNHGVPARDGIEK